MKRLTKLQKAVLRRIVEGDRFWRYSRENFGWLLAGSRKDVKDKMVLRRTWEPLEEAGLIEVDFDQTHFRDSGVNDDVYKATEKAKELCQSK